MTGVNVRILPPLGMRLGLADAPRTVSFDEELRPGDTVLELLRRLAVRHPGLVGVVLDGQLASIVPSVIVTVDQRRITGQRALHASLENGAQILIMPPLAGG
jgi:molybdopterin converting factor small subunit